MATERIVPLCPATAARPNPGTSALSIVASVSPMRSPVWPQPEPRTSATSCVGDAGALGDDGRGRPRDLERVGGRVGQVGGARGRAALLGHAGTLPTRAPAGAGAGRGGWMRAVNARQSSVVILGGGPGGYEAALVAAHLGATRDGGRPGRARRGGRADRLRAHQDAHLHRRLHVASSSTASDLGVHLEDHEGDEVTDSVAELTAVNRRILALAAAQSRDIGARLDADGVTGAARHRAGCWHRARSRPSWPTGRPQRLDGRRRARRHRRHPPRGAVRPARRRAHPHLAADLRPGRAARAPRRRRLRRHRRRAGAGLPRAGLAGHARLLPRPGAPRRGRRRGHRHRGRLPQARHGRARPLADGVGRAHGRRRRGPAGRRPRGRGQPRPARRRARCRRPPGSGWRRPASR